MDGLLVDTEPLQYRAYVNFLTRRNITFSEDQFRAVIGRTDSSILSELSERHRLSGRVERFVEERRKIYHTLLRSEATLMPGAPRLMRAAREAGLRTAVASSSTAEEIEIALTTTRTRDLVDVFVSGHDVQHGKPAPDVYRAALSGIELSCDECVALEDSATGVASATSVPLVTVAIPNRFTIHHDFSKATIVLSSLADVTVDLLQELLSNP